MRSPTASLRLTRTPSGHWKRDFASSWPILSALKIGGDQLVLALEPLADQRLDGAKLDVEQRRKRADINDVLVELALPRVGIFRGADLGQRHAQDLDVVAGQKMRDGPGRIVEEVAARLDRGDILRRRSAGSWRPGCRRRRARPKNPLRSPALRTRSAGPGCSRGRCCAARSARPCAGSNARTGDWRLPIPSR